MASNKWIHCNLCYELFCKKQRSFYLMSCLHLLCRKCMGLSNRGTFCPVCKRQGLSFSELNQEMNPKLKANFQTEQPKRVEAVVRAINFQRRQKKHLIDQMVLTESKLLQLEQTEQQLKQKTFELTQTLEKARNHRRNIQEVLRQRQGCSPGDSPNQQINQPNQQQQKRSKASNIFDAHASSSSSSHHTRMSCESADGRNSSFLNMKGSSSSGSGSLRSVDFGNTPSSTGQINETFHKMKISR